MKKAATGYQATVPRVWELLERLMRAYLRLPLWQHGLVVDLWGLARAVVVAVVLWLLPCRPGTCCSVAAFTLACLVVLDILVYQTATILTQDWPVFRLRMLFLTFVGYATIGLSFGVFYALQRDAFNRSPGTFDLIYFSFITLATIGYGDLSPSLSYSLAETTVIAEHMIGLYYLAVVIVVIVNMTTTTRVVNSASQTGEQHRSEGC